jgi:hypothetical protein
MWLVPNGAPAHFNRMGEATLRLPALGWPSISLGLNHPDYFLWGHEKDVMCASALDIAEELLLHVQIN